MNIKPIVVIPFVCALLFAGACGDSKPVKSSTIERAKPPQPLLTSTAPLAAPKPIEAAVAKPRVTESPKAALTEQIPLEDLPADEPKSFEPELDSFEGLTVQRLVTAPGVEHREPVAATSVFGHHDERIFAFVELSNETEEDKSVLVHFIGPDGGVSGGIELRVPANAPRWRTWAYTRNAKKPGLWRVELRSQDGTLVGSLPFEVEPGC